MTAEYDFIIVGSGAGGGPLACRLALAPEGYRVALLEAGTDPAATVGPPTYYNQFVPGLHARSTEDPRLSWEFFVHHYANPDRHKKAYDSKFDEAGGGIFYPRAAAVGGCTAHHAMVTLYPHNADWEKMAKLTGDSSWSADNMRKIFQDKIEACQYLPRPKPKPADKPKDPEAADKPKAAGTADKREPSGAAEPKDDDPRHGFDGWLPLSMPDPTLPLGDELLLQILFAAYVAGDAARQQDRARRAGGAAVAGGKKTPQQMIEDAVRNLLGIVQQAAQRDPNSVHLTPKELGQELEQMLEQAREKGTKDVNVKALLDFFMSKPDLQLLFRQAYVLLDPNRWWANDADRVGVFSTPASILHGVRTGVREQVLRVRALHPGRLDLISGALATEVILEGGHAVGVKYYKKERVYQATPKQGPADAPPAQTEEIRVRKGGEVILAGGTFNTPQLLMLSGIGDPALLPKGIEPRCVVPGVGRNLQDRYEIVLVSELPTDKKFTILDGLKFRAPGEDPNTPTWKETEDRGLTAWANHRGVYATNGVVITIILRSKSADPADNAPDLFIFGAPGNFRGYYRHYSEFLQNDEKTGKENPRRFTWLVLKGRTRNRAGTVQLTSKDPWVRPAINFNYFDEGTQTDEDGKKGWENDRDALAEGIRFVQGIMASTKLDMRIVVPDAEVLKDREKNEKLWDYILRESWGHHACGTCKIGKDDDTYAVLDGDFRVRGVENLRVVDASVFPEIPGFFIVTSVYMISEKAADAILRDRREPANKKPWPGKPPVR
jgi:choline dehydrogenase